MKSRKKTGEGSLQYCYNAQVAANEHGVIVAAGVATVVRNVGQFVPMVESVNTNTDQEPSLVLADAGCSGSASFGRKDPGGVQCDSIRTW